MEQLKYCGGCDRDLPRTQFYKATRQGDALQSRCKECQHESGLALRAHNRDRYAAHTQKWRDQQLADEELLRQYRSKTRARNIMATFGITVEEYEAYRKTSDTCVICGTDERLGLDHCHKTGKVRGVVCVKCNAAMGMAEDDAERLRALAEYVEAGGVL